MFQHGLGANLFQVSELLDGLPGVEWLTSDMPGHGSSNLPSAAQPGFSFYVEVLQDLVQRYYSSAVYGGISMGAGIALQTAIRFPERVRGLILVRPAWLDAVRPSALQILEGAARSLDEGTPDAFFERKDFQQIERRVSDAAQSLRGLFHPNQRPELPRVLRALVNDRPLTDRNELRAVNHPTLVIANEDDPLHPVQLARDLHEALPNSQWLEIPSRYVEREAHREALRTAIADFVERCYNAS